MRQISILITYQLIKIEETGIFNMLLTPFFQCIAACRWHMPATVKNNQLIIIKMIM